LLAVVAAKARGTWSVALAALSVKTLSPGERGLNLTPKTTDTKDHRGIF